MDSMAVGTKKSRNSRKSRKVKVKGRKARTFPLLLQAIQRSDPQSSTIQVRMRIGSRIRMFEMG